MPRSRWDETQITISINIIIIMMVIIIISCRWLQRYIIRNSFFICCWNLRTALFLLLKDIFFSHTHRSIINKICKHVIQLFVWIVFVFDHNEKEREQHNGLLVSDDDVSRWVCVIVPVRVRGQEILSLTHFLASF